MNENILPIAMNGRNMHQCLKCSYICPLLYNMKRHFVRHVSDDEEMSAKLDHFITANALIQQKHFTCKLCRKVLTRTGKNEVKLHFMTKHIFQIL